MQGKITVTQADSLKVYTFTAPEKGWQLNSHILVVCGDRDICTPLYLSEEIAAGIWDAHLSVLSGRGHFIHDEPPERYFDTVGTFIDRH
jgi:pimeloyl-ACP methyl ester carboxylesterase